MWYLFWWKLKVAISSSHRMVMVVGMMVMVEMRRRMMMRLMIWTVMMNLEKLLRLN
jgi:hypothetical protein